jgi:hypothetical protein
MTNATYAYAIDPKRDLSATPATPIDIPVACLVKRRLAGPVGGGSRRCPRGGGAGCEAAVAGVGEPVWAGAMVVWSWGPRFPAARVIVFRCGRYTTRRSHNNLYVRSCLSGVVTVRTVCRCPAAGIGAGPASTQDRGSTARREGCQLRHRPQTRPVGYASDTDRRGRWRRRQNREPVDGVADRPEAAPRGDNSKTRSRCPTGGRCRAWQGTTGPFGIGIFKSLISNGPLLRRRPSPEIAGAGRRVLGAGHAGKIPVSGPPRDYRVLS